MNAQGRGRLHKNRKLPRGRDGAAGREAARGEQRCATGGIRRAARAKRGADLKGAAKRAAGAGHGGGRGARREDDGAPKRSGPERKTPDEQQGRAGRGGTTAQNEDALAIPSECGLKNFELCVPSGSKSSNKQPAQDAARKETAGFELNRATRNDSPPLRDDFSASKVRTTQNF